MQPFEGERELPFKKKFNLQTSEMADKPPRKNASFSSGISGLGGATRKTSFMDLNQHKQQQQQQEDEMAANAIANHPSPPRRVGGSVSNLQQAAGTSSNHGSQRRSSVGFINPEQLKLIQEAKANALKEEDTSDDDDDEDEFSIQSEAESGVGDEEGDFSEQQPQDTHEPSPFQDPFRAPPPPASSPPFNPPLSPGGPQNGIPPSYTSPSSPLPPPSIKRKSSLNIAIPPSSSTPALLNPVLNKVKQASGGLPNVHGTVKTGSIQSSLASLSEMSMAGAQQLQQARKRSGAGNRSQLSTNSSIRFLDIISFWVGKIWSHPFIRALRRIWNSARMEMGLALAFYFAATIALVVLCTLIPSMSLGSIKIYNSIHIIANLLGHAFLTSALYLCFSMHRAIVAVKINDGGSTIKEIDSSPYFGETPGTYLRLFIVVSAVFTEIFLALATYDFAFTPQSSLLTIAPCTPATYPTLPTPVYDMPWFIQGMTDVALIYDFVLPLADGAVGGWSSWPLVNPASKFSVSRKGTVYALNVKCFDEYSANATTTYPGTKIVVSSVQEYGNFLEGMVWVYVPTGSTASPMDTGYGVNQICQVSVGFGVGTVEFNFISDEWQMVTFSQIQSISIAGSPTLIQGTSASTFFEQVQNQMTTDPYSLTPFYAELLQLSFNSSTTFGSSQGASFANILQWATLPDGLYYPNMTWKGISAAMGTVGNYMLMNYNGTAIDSCNYKGFTGSGVVTASGPWLSIIQITLFVQLGLVVLTLAWMYLVYPVSIEADLVYPIIGKKLLFGHAMRWHAPYYFEDDEFTFETLHDDILKKFGDTSVYFGVKRESIDQGVYHVSFGPKKQVIPIHKILKMAKRNARLAKQQQQDQDGE